MNLSIIKAKAGTFVKRSENYVIIFDLSKDKLFKVGGEITLLIELIWSSTSDLNLEYIKQSLEEKSETFKNIKNKDNFINDALNYLINIDLILIENIN